ncbi:MAG: glycosyltransferase 61 family protein, partial [Paracoccaceae bacterium]
DVGFFKQFSRIVFTGASMGGFAALVYSTLVPGSTVLAFSPQSSLARSLVPFDKRYHYSQKAWDWGNPEHRDGAAATERAAEIFLVYDPFVPEDKKHAARIIGPQVRHIHAGHLGHRAIRLMKPNNALQILIDQIVQGRFDAPSFARAMRGRRQELAFQRALFAASERRNHLRLTLYAAQSLLRADPTALYPQRVVARFATLCGLLIRPPALPMQEILTLAAAPRKGPFNHHLARLGGAYVVPERPHDTKLASGVLLSDRSYCDLSRGWIRAGKAMPQPTISSDEAIEDLPGRHLFAGHFRGHFGHFLVESTARLWALGHVKDRYDSILYLPYRGEVGPIARAIQAQAGFFKLLGIDTPIRTHATTLRVEELHVPELGFGWLERYAGSPAYRKFMQDRLNATVLAEGSDKLYISRARLNPQRGGVLCEAAIEENLARLGYEIFHPEKHPLEVQIARYRAARQIIALDGSALHLAAYVLSKDAKVAMILRRSKANAADYVLQYQSFAGITPHVIDVITRDWVAGDATRVDFRSVGEIDFSALFGWLKGLGMVPPEFRPSLPDANAIKSMLDSYQDKRGEPFRALTPGERFPDVVED